MAKVTLIILFLICVLGAHAQTINAATCSSTDVQAALNAVAADNTIVNIPAGTCTWTIPVVYNQVYSAVIQGQTTCTGTPPSACVDSTVITDGVNHASTDPPLLQLNTAGGKSLRLTGLTFLYTGNTTTTFNGAIRFTGSSHAVRLDHSNFVNIKAVAIVFFGWIYGVVDHVIVLQPAATTYNAIKIDHPGWNGDRLGVGDQSWADATTLGSERFIFIEDSSFSNGAANDCTDGGRWVWRNNVMNMTSPAPSVQTHPTAGVRRRGCRAFEIYNNTFIATAGNYINAAYFVSAGTGVVWGNRLPSSTSGGGTGYRSVISGHVMRYNNSTYPETATPNGWGYCGTTFTGVGSNWDGNTDSTTGYPCLDQIGRGKGDLIINDFPNAVNQLTGSISWPHQQLEPIYEWLDAYSPVPSNPSHIWSETEPQAIQNRDYYLGTADTGKPIVFDGTSGVGSGLLSARPSACTPLVAYWATDSNTLFQCSSTNTWTVYYKPYTYPHPLTASIGGQAAPSPPTALQVIVR